MGVDRVATERVAGRPPCREPTPAPAARTRLTAESSVASSDRILPATLRSTSRATVIRPPPPGCGAVHGGAAGTVSG